MWRIVAGGAPITEKQGGLMPDYYTIDEIKAAAERVLEKYEKVFTQLAEL